VIYLLHADESQDPLDPRLVPHRHQFHQRSAATHHDDSKRKKKEERRKKKEEISHLAPLVASFCQKDLRHPLFHLRPRLRVHLTRKGLVLVLVQTQSLQKCGIKLFLNRSTNSHSTKLAITSIFSPHSLSIIAHKPLLTPT
jgi:hypothetical protein